MNYNTRVVHIENREEALKELAKIGCDSFGVNLMSDKMVFRTLKIEKVKIRAALILKQTMLSKGAEAAVTREAANFGVEYTDVLISATVKQYKQALSTLKLQPWGLKQIAAEIEAVINSLEKFHCLYRKYDWPDNKSLTISPGRTLVMGILNITPDSFSDGGKFHKLDLALKHAQQLIDDGADILDLGAESTRPYGSCKVSAQEELERLMPVLEKVLDISPVPVSIDTYKSSVARETLKAGAHMINDIWGLQLEPQMAEVVAEFKVPVIMMHNKEKAEYEHGVMSHICQFLRESIKIGLNAGIKQDKLIIDPGIGFAKNLPENLTVMSRLEELKALDCPILLGTSRKLFIGKILDLPPGDRVEGTGATVAVGIMKGANIVRVHDVKPIVRIARMTDAINI